MKITSPILLICAGILSACQMQTPAPVVMGTPGTQREMVAQVEQKNVVVNEVRMNQASYGEPPQLLGPESVDAADVASAARAANDGNYQQHQVVAGDTLYSLADRYRTTPEAILRANQLRGAEELNVGKILNIPDKKVPGGSVWEDMGRLVREKIATNQQKLRPVTAQASAPNHSEKIENIEPAAGDMAALVRVPTVPAAAPLQPENVQRDTYQGTVNNKINAPIMHQVQPKETIYRISQQYGVSVLDVMVLNEFEKPQDLKAGTMVKIPAKGTGQAVTPPNRPLETFEETATLAERQLAETGRTVSDSVPEAGQAVTALRTEPVAEPEDVVFSAKPNWKEREVLARAAELRGQVNKEARRSSGLVWPARGKVIRGYGADREGAAYSGINIALEYGSPVMATMPGEVLYADDGLKTYGKMVLLRHDNGMISAYAHNSQLLVRRGERVQKGQYIALSGDTGNVVEPQLHFELRKQSNALNPLAYLPR